MVKNILTFDAEEWYDVYNYGVKSSKAVCENRLNIGISKIFSFLDDKKINATFFVSGSAAEKNPQVIREIDKRGHEIASHGYRHVPISGLNREEFRQDLLRSVKILEDITGKKVIGYRAPCYSVTADTLWALDIIKESGLKYDSSIYPVSLRLATKGGAFGYPRRPFFVKEGLLEFPLATLNLFGIYLPAATTAYFRIFPYCVSYIAIKNLNKTGVPATVNFHSWEFDENHPKLKLPFPHNIKHYYNLSKTSVKFKRLIENFDFSSCLDKLNETKI